MEARACAQPSRAAERSCAAGLACGDVLLGAASLRAAAFSRTVRAMGRLGLVCTAPDGAHADRERDRLFPAAPAVEPPPPEPPLLGAAVPSACA